MKVEDNGKGFDPNQISTREGQRHLGLISMSERAELIGGKLDMFSTLGEGTIIKVKIPVSQINPIEENE